MRPRARIPLVAVALLALPASAGLAQSVPAGTAKNAVGVLVVIRTDGVETRLRGHGAVRIFEGDVLRMDGKGKALIETDEGVQIALNGDSVVQMLSRWEKEHGVTRVLRLQRGEVWARIADTRRIVEIETPVAVLAARAAEVNVRLVSENEAVATVVTGSGELSTPFASCALHAGTMSSSQRSKGCTPPTPIDVRTVVGWSRPLVP